MDKMYQALLCCRHVAVLHDFLASIKSNVFSSALPPPRPSGDVSPRWHDLRVLQLAEVAFSPLECNQRFVTFSPR